MKKYKLPKNIIYLISFILLISLVSAATYEQSKELDLKVPCINNNTFCSGSATCNLTILYPNSTALVFGVAMTNAGTYHNYTLDGNQTTVLGEYSTTVVCTDGSEGGYSTFIYKINPTGHEITQAQGFSSMGLILGVILIAAMFSFFGFKFSESEKLFPIALFFMVISLIVSVYAMQLGYIYSRDMLWTLGIAGMQFTMLYSLMWGFLGITFIALMWMIFKTLGELRARKSLQKEQKDSDGYDNHS